MSELFISHSSEDNELAVRLKASFEAKRYPSVFLDLENMVVGHDWERTLYRQLRRSRGLVVVCTDRYLASQWCFAELALTRMERKPVFTVLADPLSVEIADLPGMLSQQHLVDLRGNPIGAVDAFLQALEAGLDPCDEEAEDSDPESRMPPGATKLAGLFRGLADSGLPAFGRPLHRNESPYRGLEPFLEEHAAVYFGRDEEIHAGVRLLNRGSPNFVMMLGASGTGKSSLVRAGIVPRLRGTPREREPAARRPKTETRPGEWLLVDPFRPGPDPYHSLAASLAAAYDYYVHEPVGRTDTETIYQRLLQLRGAVPHGSDPATCDPEAGRDEELVTLIDELRAQAERSDGRVLIVIDQFEELLGAGRQSKEMVRVDGDGEGEAREVSVELTEDFLEALRRLLADTENDITVLGTMRSDFLDAFQRHEMLRGVDFSSLSLGPMTDEGLESVIRDPAESMHVTVDPKLVEALARDARAPDALPLLSFTLAEMYQIEGVKRGGLTLAAYQTRGGLEGSISTAADAILQPEGQRRSKSEIGALREAFTRLARPTARGGFVRRTASWNDEKIVPAHGVLAQLERKRLLVRRTEAGEDVVEVAHEALLRSARTIRGWLEENRERVMLLDQLSRDARTWHALRKELWQRRDEADAEASGSDAEAVRAAKSNRLLTFVAGVSSLWKTKDALWGGARLARAIDLVMARHSKWDLLRSAVARQTEGETSEPNQAALEQRFLFTSWFRARLVVGVVTLSVVVTALLVGEFGRRTAAERDRATGQLARLAAVQALAERRDGVGRSLLVALTAHDVAPSPESRTGLVSILAETQNLEGLAYHHHALARAVAMDPAGQYLASGGDDGVLHVANLASRRTHWIDSAPFGDDDVQPVAHLDISASGQHVAALGRTLVIRELGTGDETGRIAPPADISFERLRFHPTDPDLLALARSDGSVQLWSVAGALAPVASLPGLGAPVTALDFDPVGRSIATADDQGRIRVWDLEGTSIGGDPRELTPPDASTVLSLAFNVDGSMLATSTEAGWVGLYDPVAGTSIYAFHADPGVIRSVVFCGVGRRDLVAAGPEGDLVRWSLTGVRDSLPPTRAAIGFTTSGARALACSQEGGRLASAGFHGAAQYWRMGVTDGVPVLELGGHELGLNSIGFDAGGTRAITGGDDLKVFVWDLTTHSRSMELASTSEPIRGVALASDGMAAAVGDRSGRVDVYHLRPDGPVAVGTFQGDTTWAVAFQPGDSLLAIGRVKGVTSLLARSVGDGGVPAWRHLVDLPTHSDSGRVRALTFSTDGRHLAAARGAPDTSKVYVWDLADPAAPTLAWVTPGQPRSILAVEFLRSGPGVRTGPPADLFAGSQDGYVLPWSLALRGDSVAEEGTRLSAYEGELQAIAVDPTTGWLAAASGPRVLVWDPAEADHKLELVGHTDDVQGMYFRDGVLLTGGRDRTIRRWPLPLSTRADEAVLDMDRVHAAACQRAGRELTEEEWRTFFGEVGRTLCVR